MRSATRFQCRPIGCSQLNLRSSLRLIGMLSTRTHCAQCNATRVGVSQLGDRMLVASSAVFCATAREILVSNAKLAHCASRSSCDAWAQTNFSLLRNVRPRREFIYPKTYIGRLRATATTTTTTAFLIKISPHARARTKEPQSAHTKQ